MSLLDVITKASSEPHHASSDHPIVIDPLPIFPNLKPKLADPNPISPAIALSGWAISQTDSDLVDLGRKFATNLKKKLKNPVKFDKAEFSTMLRVFLEKVGAKVGVSIGEGVVDLSVLVEKVGEYMGKEVSGLVSESCVALEAWDLAGSLIANGLVSGLCYGDLVARIVEKRRTELVCACLKYASDLGVDEVVMTLKYFLSPSKDAYDGIVEVRKEWEGQAVLAVEKASDRGLSGKKVSMAKEAAVLLMVAVDGFSAAEICLHYLLGSKNVDEVVLASAVSKLSGKEMLSLVRYLGKWLKNYERFPQAGPCPKASTTLGLKVCDWVPKLEDVLKCTAVVLDENYSVLVLHLEFHEELRSINNVVSSSTLEARLCCSVANVADKLIAEVKRSQNQTK